MSLPRGERAFPGPICVGVNSEKQEINHKITKDTKLRALFFLVTFVPCGGESISLAFGQKETGAEKSQRNQSNYPGALWSYLAAPFFAGRELPLNA